MFSLSTISEQFATPSCCSVARVPKEMKGDSMFEAKCIVDESATVFKADVKSSSSGLILLSKEPWLDKVIEQWGESERLWMDNWESLCLMLRLLLCITASTQTLTMTSKARTAPTILPIRPARLLNVMPRLPGSRTVMVESSSSKLSMDKTENKRDGKCQLKSIKRLSISDTFK